MVGNLHDVVAKITNVFFILFHSFSAALCLQRCSGSSPVWGAGAGAPLCLRGLLSVAGCGAPLCCGLWAAAASRGVERGLWARGLQQLQRVGPVSRAPEHRLRGGGAQI